MGVEALLVSQNFSDRIRESAATTGAGLVQEVKRQYLHDCGHIGTEAINGLITGDGVGMADQVLREAIVMNRSNGMYVTEKSEAVSGFSRAIGELVQAWPSAQQVS